MNPSKYELELLMESSEELLNAPSFLPRTIDLLMTKWQSYLALLGTSHDLASYSPHGYMIYSRLKNHLHDQLGSRWTESEQKSIKPTKHIPFRRQQADKKSRYTEDEINMIRPEKRTSR